MAAGLSNRHYYNVPVKRLLSVSARRNAAPERIGLRRQNARTASKTGADANALPLTIHADQPGIALSPDLYGVFFEEINHAGDGGLYAEKIQNGRFAEGMKGWKSIIPTRRTHDRDREGWRGAGGISRDEWNGRGGIQNEGYWGIGVEKGQAYTCAFDIRADNPKMELTAWLNTRA